LFISVILFCLLQFYGESAVEAPKGTDVVKDAIRKRKVSII